MRFPEFGGEWEKYKVSDVLDFYSTNSLSWEQLDYDNEELHNLHYGLIHVGLPILVDIRQNKLPGIKTDCKPKNFELCKEGDVAFADASEDTNDVAKAIEFINLNNQKVVCGLHTIHGRDNKGLTVPGYKGYTFASPLFHNQIRKIAQGTKIYSISSKNFAECYIGIPSREEQSKIAKLLALIDTRISTQIKIIEDLKKLKVAISYRLLNNNALLYKTASLSKFGELKNGYAFKSSAYAPNGNYNIITIANVSGSREISADGTNTISSLPKDIQSHQILKSGDILISLTGNVGRVSLNKGNNNLLNQRVGLFVPNNSISSEFLYQTLSFVQFENSMINLAQGAAQMNIGKSDVESYQVRYSDNQQLINKISQILLDYDKKIEIENKYLQSLLSQKAFLLSNMFI